MIYGAGGLRPGRPPRRPRASFRELARSLARASADVQPLEALAAAIRAAVLARRAASRSRRAGLLPGELDALRALLPGIELGDGSVLLRLIRMVKTDDEIERSRRAAEIGEGALAAMVAAAAPGRTLAELAQVFRRAVAEAAPISSTSRSARSGSASRPSRAIACASATCSCSTSAACTARASPTPASRWRSSRSRARPPSATTSCATASRPGARGARPRRARLGGLPGDAGVVDGTLAERSLPQGHGLGLEPRELPFIGPPTDLRLADDVVDLAVDQTLEPGMVINLEVPLDKPGHYAVHVERTFVITAGGVEPITPQDRSQAALAGPASH